MIIKVLVHMGISLLVVNENKCIFSIENHRATKCNCPNSFRVKKIINHKKAVRKL